MDEPESVDIEFERATIEIVRRAMVVGLEARDEWLQQQVAPPEVLRAAQRLLDATDEEEGQDGALAEVLSPRRIDRFEIEALIGVGGSAQVYRAFDPDSGERVALKLLYRDSSDEETQRFVREARILRELSHPGIARLVDAGTAERGATRVHWLAMELVTGMSFRDAVLGRSDQRGIVDLLVDLGRAVAHAHSMGILHRDLKPANIVLGADGRPVVLDFGVSRWTGGDTITRPGQVVGTAAYIGPEHLAGEPIDERGDQFSLGVIAFQALTGELPRIDDATGAAGLLSLAAWDGRLPSRALARVDRDLAAVLSKALDFDPALRYPSVEGFTADLERWLRGERVVARHPGPWQRTVRFARRNRREVTAAAVVFAFLLGALGVTLWSLVRERAAGVRVEASRELLHALELVRRIDELWPETSATVPLLEAWLDEVGLLQRREATHLAGLEDADQRARFRGALDELAGLAGVAEARLERARAVRAQTMEGDAVELWRAVRERVAADARFDGLTLEPIEGLLPLGPDPASGLEEFALPSSGDVPPRGEDGALTLTDAMGALLVLIPGGVVTLGTELTLRDEVCFFDGRFFQPTEDPRRTREVTVDPFLVGKFEVTQAQWLRIMGANPSDRGPGDIVHDLVVTLRHPVETVDQADALTFVGRLDCTLPTEAQWLRAAHPIERGLFWFSETIVPVRAPENFYVGDGVTGPPRNWPFDPYVLHAPVGTFAPNPYGLYDVGGNVRERCLDPFKVHMADPEAVPLRVGDGLALADGGGDTSIRGGFSLAKPCEAPLVNRWGLPASQRDWTIGLRLARSLEID